MLFSVLVPLPPFGRLAECILIFVGDPSRDPAAFRAFMIHPSVQAPHSASAATPKVDTCNKPVHPAETLFAKQRVRCAESSLSFRNCAETEENLFKKFEKKNRQHCETTEKNCKHIASLVETKKPHCVSFLPLFFSSASGRNCTAFSIFVVPVGQ